MTSLFSNNHSASLLTPGTISAGGIFNQEQPIQFAINIQTICEQQMHTIYNLCNRMCQGKITLESWQSCVAVIPNWPKNVIHQKYIETITNYPDIESVFMNVFIENVKEIYKNHANTRLKVRKPTFKDFLQRVFAIVFTTTEVRKNIYLELKSTEKMHLIVTAIRKVLMDLSKECITFLPNEPISSEIIVSPKKVTHPTSSSSTLSSSSASSSSSKNGSTKPQSKPKPSLPLPAPIPVPVSVSTSSTSIQPSSDIQKINQYSSETPLPTPQSSPIMSVVSTLTSTSASSSLSSTPPSVNVEPTIIPSLVLDSAKAIPKPTESVDSSNISTSVTSEPLSKPVSTPSIVSKPPLPAPTPTSMMKLSTPSIPSGLTKKIPRHETPSRMIIQPTIPPDFVHGSTMGTGSNTSVEKEKEKELKETKELLPSSSLDNCMVQDITKNTNGEANKDTNVDAKIDEKKEESKEQESVVQTNTEYLQKNKVIELSEPVLAESKESKEPKESLPSQESIQPSTRMPSVPFPYFTRPVQDSEYYHEPSDEEQEEEDQDQEQEQEQEEDQEP